MVNLDDVEQIDTILDNIYLIKKGVRSCYTTTISGYNEQIFRTIVDKGGTSIEIYHSVHDKLKSLERLTIREGLLFHSYRITSSEENPNGMYQTYAIWICKYKHQIEIIGMLEGNKSFIEEWIVGKLLGYSDEAMEEHLTKITTEGVN